MGARGGATGEATELRGWNTEPRQMPLAQTEPALGGAPALRSPLRSSQSKRGATSNAADGDTVVRTRLVFIVQDCFAVGRPLFISA